MRLYSGYGDRIGTVAEVVKKLEEDKKLLQRIEDEMSNVDKTSLTYGILNKERVNLAKSIRELEYCQVYSVVYRGKTREVDF